MRIYFLHFFSIKSFKANSINVSYHTHTPLPFRLLQFSAALFLAIGSQKYATLMNYTCRAGRCRRHRRPQVHRSIYVQPQFRYVMGWILNDECFNRVAQNQLQVLSLHTHTLTPTLANTCRHFFSGVALVRLLCGVGQQGIRQTDDF